VEHTRPQQVFTHTAHVSVTVMIFIRQQLTHIHSDIVASPYLHALRYILYNFLFFY